MPSFEEVTNPHLSTYRPVPPIGPGVCRICHGAPRSTFTRCLSCSRTMGAVSNPISLVVPISLIHKDQSQLYHVLKMYKREGAVGADKFQLQVAGMIGRFLKKHGSCIEQKAGMSWDVITVVPSTRPDRPIHPLEQCVKMLKAFEPQYRRLLKKGSTTVAARQAADDKYITVTSVTDRRVLLVDDTFTSGAHVQSAASALELGSAKVVAAVVVGRMIDTEFTDAARQLWEKAKGQPFSFDVCCL
jgi:predicted amidophosphoribosyltransferase